MKALLGFTLIFKAFRVFQRYYQLAKNDPMSALFQELPLLLIPHTTTARYIHSPLMSTKVILNTRYRSVELPGYFEPA